MRKRSLLSFLAFAVLTSVFWGGVEWLEKRKRRAQYQARYEMETRLAAVCAGEGVPEAAAYPSTSALHPILYVKQTTTGFSTDFGYRTPEDWEPQRLEDAELVACIVEDQVERQRCSYTLEDGRKGTVVRVQYRVSVTLRAAQTGAIIATNEGLMGGPPPECQDTEQFQANRLTRYIGGSRPNEAIDEWLRTYVGP